MFHIDIFLDRLRSAGLRPATIHAYRDLLDRLTQWCTRNGLSSAGAVDNKEVHRFLLWLRQAGVVGRQYRIAVSRLRKYFGHLEGEGRIFVSPMAAVRTPRTAEPSYPAVGREHLSAALSHLRGETEFETRARAILELAYSSALRPREVYSLRIGDIDFRRGTLSIRQSKSNKDRIVPVGRVALSWLDRYLREVRPRHLRDGSEDFAFLSHRTGRALTVKGLWWALGDALHRRHLEPIKPYSLRVSAATDLLRGGMGLFALSRLLGHSKVQTTQGYLRVEMIELEKVLSLKHPRVAAERRLRGVRHERRSTP